MEDVLDMLSAQARSKNLEIAYYIEPGIPAIVKADELRLRQVFLNLAGNAVKFTKAGHIEIVLSCSPNAVPGPTLTFHVRDTGIGIPPERKKYLFQAFSQLDPSIARTFGGTGLGLVISQRLVSLMGGTIAANSEPGVGSDFYFTIPMMTDPDQPTLLPSTSFTTPVRAFRAGESSLSTILPRIGVFSREFLQNMASQLLPQPRQKRLVLR